VAQRKDGIVTGRGCLVSGGDRRGNQIKTSKKEETFPGGEGRAKAKVRAGEANENFGTGNSLKGLWGEMENLKERGARKSLL